MRDFRDAKLMAQTLRKALAARSIKISHSEALELIAKEFGLDNWNTLSAKLAAGRSKAEPPLHPVDFSVSTKPFRRGTRLPLVPLRDVVIFPHMVIPLFMGRSRSVRAAEAVAIGDRRLVLVAQKNSLDENPGLDDLYRMGVVAVLLQHMKAPDGSVHCWVRGEQRAALLRVLAKDEINEAEIAPVAKDRPTPETQALARAVFEEDLAYAKSDVGSLRVKITQPLPGNEDPERLADAMAAGLPVTVAERQDLLQTLSISDRLEKIRGILKRELAAA